MAVLALIGLFIASYIALHKLGYIGKLACTADESCDTVQQSPYAMFMGIPVPFWGVGYYALVLVLAVAGTLDRYESSRPLALGVAILTGWGVLFSAYLTYRELFTIHAICWWCVGSATTAVCLFLLALWDWVATNQQLGRETTDVL
jgi:uncharacterized membrane protein